MESDHARTIEALREAEARNEAILNALPDMMFLLDENGNYLERLTKDSANLFVAAKQLIGRNMRDVLPPELAKTFAGRFRDVLLSNQPACVEYKLPVGDDTRVFETRIVKCGNRRLLCVVHDSTSEKRSQEEVQKLSSRLLTLQDEERRRLARELHDVTSQNLFAISINLESLRQQLLGRLRFNQMEILIECQMLCEQSLHEVRTLCYTLHPPALDKHGLAPSLQWYVAGLGKRSGLDISLQATLESGRLPLEMETDIFRIVQEGLSNAVRHSGGDSASVSLKQDDKRLVVQIRDNGRGLPEKQEKPSGASGAGVGLPIIKERLRRWGGHLHMRSGTDGVLLLAHVPIASTHANETRANA